VYVSKAVSAMQLWKDSRDEIVCDREDRLVKGRDTPEWSMRKTMRSEREVTFVYVDKEIACNKESMLLS